MDYSKFLRFLIIFMIILLTGLLVLVNFLSEVAFEFYDESDEENITKMDEE